MVRFSIFCSIQLLQNGDQLLTHFIQGTCVNASDFMDFLKVFGVLICGGFKGSYCIINNGRMSCFNRRVLVMVERTNCMDIAGSNTN